MLERLRQNLNNCPANNRAVPIIDSSSNTKYYTADTKLGYYASVDASGQS